MSKRTDAKDRSDAVVVYVEHGYASFAEGPVDVVVCDFDIQDEEPQDITVNGHRCRLTLFKARALSRSGKRVLRAAQDNSCTVDGYLC